jgi:invasion protein IalB
MRRFARLIEAIFLLLGCSIAIAAGDAPQSPIRLSYSAWSKFCQTGQDANGRRVCFTGKDGRSESGQQLIGAVIIEPEDDRRRSFA